MDFTKLIKDVEAFEVKETIIEDLEYWIYKAKFCAAECPFICTRAKGMICPCRKLWPQLRLVRYYNRECEEWKIRKFCPCKATPTNNRLCGLRLTKENIIYKKEIRAAAIALLKTLKGDVK